MRTLKLKWVKNTGRFPSSGYFILIAFPANVEICLQP